MILINICLIWLNLILLIRLHTFGNICCSNDWFRSGANPGEISQTTRVQFAVALPHPAFQFCPLFRGIPGVIMGGQGLRGRAVEFSPWNRRWTARCQIANTCIFINLATDDILTGDLLFGVTPSYETDSGSMEGLHGSNVSMDPLSQSVQIFEEGDLSFIIFPPIWVSIKHFNI